MPLGIVVGIVSWISGTLGGILSTLLSFASLAVTARRVHDIGNPTWYIVLGFIPLANLYLLYLLILEGDQGLNEYGLDPKAIL